MIGFVFFFCFLFRWGVLHSVLLVRWVMLGLVFKWFLLSEFSLFYPRVSSLVVYGLGVRVFTPKSQGIIPVQDQRLHKWFVMPLSEIKANVQTWETKDKPHTNGSYKIKQIIIKVMKYAHAHIHPWAKSKQSDKNKVQKTDPANKGNQKLYLH